MVETNLSIRGGLFIKEHEGYCPSFYADSKGYPTVGYGHLITPYVTYSPNKTGNPYDSILTTKQASDLVKKYKLPYTSPITKAKAGELFNEDVQSAVELVNKIELPSGCIFSQAQFDAMVSLVYNGGKKVLDTDDVKTLIHNRNIFAWDLTKTECDKCSRIVSRAFSYDASLKNRRNDEARLFCEGKPYTHKYDVYTL